MSNDAAFPYRYQEIPGDPVRHYHGLTKRELIAAMAMQGLLANETKMQAIQQAADRSGRNLRRMTGTIAVSYADALLDALTERSNKS